MTFAGIPNGALVFVDANTLLYHFGPHPTLQAPCQALLQRILRQEIVGVTSAHVLSDVAHRMMTIEAMNKLGWPAKGIVRGSRASVAGRGPKPTIRPPQRRRPDCRYHAGPGNREPG